MGIVLLVVDGLNLIRRVYAGTPGPDFEAAVSTTAQSLRRALTEVAPTHAVVVFDSHEPTWRHGLYPAYKSGRKPMPEELRSGLERFRDEFCRMGVQSVSKPGVEADDLVATLASGVASHGGKAVILSTDGAFCQLVSERVRVRDHFQKRELDEKYVREKFGVDPGKLVDLWALAGTGATEIPGVPGIGRKTAARLIQEHGSLDRVLEAAKGMKGKLGETLRANVESAGLSRNLACLRTDLELGWNLKSFRYAG